MRRRPRVRGAKRLRRGRYRLRCGAEVLCGPDQWGRFAWYVAPWGVGACDRLADALRLLGVAALHRSA